MVSAKSLIGRGGSSKRSRENVNVSREQVSSTSSRRLEDNQASPASVKRRSLPVQYPDGSSDAAVTPPSRFSTPVSSNRQEHPSTSQQIERRHPIPMADLQQSHRSGEMNPPVDAINQFDDHADSADESEDHSDDSDQESEDEFVQPPGQMTLDELLMMEGRDRYVDRLSPTRGERVYW